jgi:hypothetical protein
MGLLLKLFHPNYQNDMKSTGDNSVAGSGLEKLGYPTGTIIKTNKSYHLPPTLSWKELV